MNFTFSLMFGLVVGFVMYLKSYHDGKKAFEKMSKFDVNYGRHDHYDKTIGPGQDIGAGLIYGFLAFIICLSIMSDW